MILPQISEEELIEHLKIYGWLHIDTMLCISENMGVYIFSHNSNSEIISIEQKTSYYFNYIGTLCERLNIPIPSHLDNAYKLLKAYPLNSMLNEPTEDYANPKKD
ncbi:MAG: hypothetical protein HOP11_02485 [Saprospiraceae bacterium]|nr:hypothetical protein [Saprospiraceae bacterium]